MNYGIEFEFFVKDKKTDEIVPAYKATHNLDGNPIIGELKTKVHSSLLDAVFELKKLIHKESKRLNNNGFIMSIIPMIKLDKEVLLGLRKDKNYVNKKNLEVLDAKSIYGKGIGKVLPRGVFKASIQINLSDNSDIYYEEYNKITVENKSKWESTTKKKTYSSVFDYISIIRKLDNTFIEDIKNSNRVKGVFAIKDGELGKRIEYRSLPNTVNLDAIADF